MGCSSWFDLTVWPAVRGWVGTAEGGAESSLGMGGAARGNWQKLLPSVVGPTHPGQPMGRQWKGGALLARPETSPCLLNYIRARYGLG